MQLKNYENKNQTNHKTMKGKKSKKIQKNGQRRHKNIYIQNKKDKPTNRLTEIHNMRQVLKQNEKTKTNTTKEQTQKETSTFDLANYALHPLITS